MGKFVPAVIGFGAGVALLAVDSPAEREAILNEFRKEEAGIDMQLSVGPVDTRVDHLAAFAVGKLSGEVPVNASYDKTRWGPLPNCNIDIQMRTPYIAEAIVELGDIEIHKSDFTESNGFDIHAVVTDDVKPLNARNILDDRLVFEHSGDGFGQMCDPGNYTTLISDMWNTTAHATYTAAECLTQSVYTNYVTDSNGNRIQSEPNREIHDIYADGLKQSLSALYPDANEITVEFPDMPGDYNVALSESHQALAKILAEAGNGDHKYKIDTEAVDSCRFESVAIDVSSTAGTE